MYTFWVPIHKKKDRGIFASVDSVKDESYHVFHFDICEKALHSDGSAEASLIFFKIYVKGQLQYWSGIYEELNPKMYQLLIT